MSVKNWDRWGTLEEIRFIDQAIANRPRGDKVEWLRKYVAANRRRVDWGEIDKSAVMKHARGCLNVL